MVHYRQEQYWEKLQLVPPTTSLHYFPLYNVSYYKLTVSKFKHHNRRKQSLTLREDEILEGGTDFDFYWTWLID